MRRSRGYALVDFIVAASIFGGAVALAMSTTTLKYRLLGGADNRLVAVRAASSELEKVRAREVADVAAAEAKAKERSPDGWVRYRDFEVEGLPRALVEPVGRVLVRKTREEGFFEVRVQVTWMAQDKKPIAYRVTTLVRPPRKKESF